MTSHERMTSHELAILMMQLPIWCVLSLVYKWHMSPSFEAWAIHIRHEWVICDMTHLYRARDSTCLIYEWHEPFISHSSLYGSWVICEMTHLYRARDSFISDMSRSYETWLLYIGHIKHGLRLVHHDSSIAIDICTYIHKYIYIHTYIFIHRLYHIDLFVSHAPWLIHSYRKTYIHTWIYVHTYINTYT